jgi:hypothetical protein
MKLPTRIRVRTLMAIVALVAFGFGLTIELKNHAERDRLLKIQLNRYRRVAVHRMRALECESAEGKQLPYSSAARANLLSSDNLHGGIPSGGIPKGNFRSWQEELGYHTYWGNWLYAAGEDLDERLKAVEAKLLLP